MRPRNDADGRADETGLVGYGHSWVFGTGAGDGSGGFVARAAQALGLRHRNRAESGTLSTDTARLISGRPPERAEVYVIMTGFNDARLYGDDAAAQDAYATSLNTVLGGIDTVAPQARVILIEQPVIEDYSGHAPYDRASDAIVGQYNRILRETADGHPAAEVVPVADWQPGTMIAADGVHPNDHGHRHLAQTLLHAIHTERARS